ncbi:MAG TPA: phosphotriesterase, partial [Blastococcus sp.]|nr:phosphotriesterase [Blastococcus sp.]
LEHFLRLIGEGHVDQVLASADANCSPLGWPGVEGHTVNYIYEQLIPELRQEGIDDATIHRIFVENPAEFLTLTTN